MNCITANMIVGNDGLCDGIIADQWNLSNTIPVLKKGNIFKTDNEDSE